MKVDLSEVSWFHSSFKETNPRDVNGQKASHQPVLRMGKVLGTGTKGTWLTLANSEAQDVWVLKGDKAKEGGIRMRNLEQKNITQGLIETPRPALPVLLVGVI